MAQDGRTHDDLVAGPVHRLVRIELDEANAPRRTAEAEHERAIAIYDILEDNSFSLVGGEGEQLGGRSISIFGQRGGISGSTFVTMAMSSSRNSIWRLAHCDG